MLQCSHFTPELCCSVHASHLSVKHLFPAAFVDATRTIAILIVKIMTSNYTVVMNTQNSLCSSFENEQQGLICTYACVCVCMRVCVCVSVQMGACGY